MTVDKTRGVPGIAAAEFSDGSRCWNPEHPQGTIVADFAGGYKHWYDIMYCSGDMTIFVYSERVIAAFLKEGIQFEYGPVQFRDMHKKGAPALEYFYICFPSGLKYQKGRVDRFETPYVDLSTWSGADLCVAEDRRKIVFCSLRIIEIARQYKLSNFKFRIPLGVFEGPDQPVVDYLAKGKDWPPAWLSNCSNS